MGYLLKLLTFIIYGMIQNAQGEDILPMCGKATQVSCSRMRILDREFPLDFEEQTYCTCKESRWKCAGQWYENHTLDAFTWYHHERVDWLLQFQFCHNVMPMSRDLCVQEETEEVITTMKVDAEQKKWQPMLDRDSVRCRCPSNVYVMRNWRLLNETKKHAGYWQYGFTCDRPQCRGTEPCLKRYLGLSDSKPLGYSFPCSCPLGQHCPLAQVKDDKIKSEEMSGEDEGGTFIYGYCQGIPGYELGTRVQRQAEAGSLPT